MWCTGLLLTLNGHQTILHRRKSLRWFITGSLLYSKAIIIWQSRCHCKALLIREAVSHSGVELAHKKVHLRAGRNEAGGYYLWLWCCGSRDTGCLLAKEGLEQRECFQAAMNCWEGTSTELAAKLSEVGSFRGQARCSKIKILKSQKKRPRSQNQMEFALGDKTETVIKINLDKRQDPVWCWWMSCKVVGGVEDGRRSAQG